MTELSREETASTSGGVLRNFRPVPGTNERIYRSGSTDPLATRVDVVDKQYLTEAESIFLYDVTLSIDFRSIGELQEGKQEIWTSKAQGGQFTVVSSGKAEHVEGIDRVLFRSDMLKTCIPYMDATWLSHVPTEELKEMDTNKAMKLRMQQAQKLGMLGLYEVLLQENKQVIREALQAIVLHLESNKTNKVAINCSQGKDRTGLLAMLIESAIGLSDGQIINDYSKSNAEFSAAMEEVHKKLGIDKQTVAEGGPELMKNTLEMIRNKYGSASPEYLDEIGFDESWRSRLRVVLS